MLDDELITTLRRKAGAGRAPREITAMTTPKALRLAVAKAADEAIGLRAVVQNVEETQLSLAALIESVPEYALIMLLEGPFGARALAVLDAQATSAFVEFQTTGALRTGGAQPRTPTATDASMCTEFLDNVLTQLEGTVAQLDAPPPITGFGLLGRVSEVRSLAVGMDDITYRHFDLALDLCDGARAGRMLLCFPFDSGAPHMAASRKDGGTSEFGASVLDAEACLDTVLLRMSLTLNEVSDLAAGQTLKFPAAALTAVELVADGAVICHARLGQVNGNRAVRIAFSLPDQTAPKPQPRGVDSVSLDATVMRDGGPAPQNSPPRDEASHVQAP